MHPAFTPPGVQAYMGHTPFQHPSFYGTSHSSSGPSPQLSVSAGGGYFQENIDQVVNDDAEQRKLQIKKVQEDAMNSQRNSTASK